MGQVFTVEQATFATLRALNYSPASEKFRKKSAHRRCMRLRHKLRAMGPAYGTVFVRIDCATEHGIELLSQSDMFASEPAGRVIRRDSLAEPEKHQIRRGQILIAGAGTLGETELYGRSIIADGRLAGKYVGPDAMVLDFEDPDSDESLYLYAFLASRTGVQAVRSTSYGTKIVRLRSDLLADLPIPLPDEETLAHVARLIRQAVDGRECYLRELRAARKLLENLPEMREAHAMCADRKARAIAWDGDLPTISAWTFASTGGALGFLQKRWSTRLRDVLGPNGVFNGPRFARIGCASSHGIPFLSQRDAFLIRPIVRHIVHPSFTEDLLYVPIGSLLVGGHGTLGEGEIFGQAVYVSDDLAKVAFTQDLLRIQIQSAYTRLAYAYFSTLVGFRLLRSTAVGTKMLSMRPDLLGALPFPSVDVGLLSAIDRHLEHAVTARLVSNSAEAEAVRIVEQEVLPSWLA